jgi:hypothetical protein
MEDGKLLMPLLDGGHEGVGMMVWMVCMQGVGLSRLRRGWVDATGSG